MYRRVLSAIVALMIALSLLTPIASAQESTGEPPTVPTDVPAVDVTPVQQPGFSLLEFATGALSGALAVLISMFGIIGKLKNDPVAMAAMERLADSVPAELVLKLNLLGAGMRDSGDVLVNVTDGQPTIIKPPDTPQPGLVG